MLSTLIFVFKKLARQRNKKLQRNSKMPKTLSDAHIRGGISMSQKLPVFSFIGDRRFSLWIKFCARLGEKVTNNTCVFIVNIHSHISYCTLLWGYLAAIFPHLSKLLLLFNFFQRGAKLNSDLLAQACHSKAGIFINTYKLQIYVRLQPPFVAEIKIVTFEAGSPPRQPWYTVQITSRCQYVAVIKALEHLYNLYLPIFLCLITHFIFWGKAMSTSEIFVTEDIRLTFPPSTIGISEL